MKISRIILPIIALFAYTNILIAQVGIGTTTPEETLHVAGTVKVDESIHVVGTLQIDDTNPGSAVKLIGIDGSSVISEISFGSNINLNAGVLSASGGGDDHTKETIALIDMDFAEFDNLNLGLDGTTGIYGDNSDVTVFIIRDNDDAGTLDINGITGGTDGRRIRIVNDSGLDIEFYGDDAGATAGNKIYIYTQRSILREYGSCELIYSTAVSTDGHWCIVQLDRFTRP